MISGERVAVIGAGTMGHGMGFALARKGYQVTLMSRKPSSLELARRAITDTADLFLDHDLMSKDEREETLSRIEMTTCLEKALDGATYVFEAVPEDLDTKREVLRQAERFMLEDGLLASTTSAFVPSLLTGSLTRPERFVVAHFWNPPSVVALVEVVPAPITSGETVKEICELLQRIEKFPVVLKKEIPGFIGNRLQLAVLREALWIVESGAAGPAEVDQVMKMTLGQRWARLGPIEAADLGGLDVFLAISDYLGKTFQPAFDPPEILQEKVSQGKLGAKTGEGFYLWSDDRARKVKRDRDQALLQYACGSRRQSGAEKP